MSAPSEIILYNLFFKAPIISLQKTATNGRFSPDMQLTNGRRIVRKKFYDALEEEDDVVPDLPVYDDQGQHRFARLSRSSSAEGFFLCFDIIYLNKS